MFSIQGFRDLQEIHESRETLIYRGIREVDHSAVVLKLLRNPYPTPDEVTLPYISPAQTGRTNRLLDYRTDFLLPGPQPGGAGARARQGQRVLRGAAPLPRGNAAGSRPAGLT